MESDAKIASIRLTAEELSDKLTTNFKSAAPIEVIFDGSGKPQETVSRRSGDKYHVPRIEGRNYAPGNAAVYRIPALVVTKQGTILAFAEARASGFDWGHIRLVVRRSEDNGKTWGPEIDTSNGKFPDHKIGNPVPIVDRETGRIFLIGHFAVAGHVHSGDQQVMVVHSDDDGKSWSDARLIPMGQWLPQGFHWMLSGPGHGIQLRRGSHKGRLIAPCYGHGTGYVVYSDDHGKTWKVGARSPAGPYNEATCVELSNGDIMLNTRSPGGGGGRTPNRGTAVLTDGGETYKEGTSRFIPDLPCPSCQAGTARLTAPKDGDPGVILFAGPGLPTGRVRGTLWASYDDGKTWPYKTNIYEGGYGYSDIITLRNGKVACIFELNKQDLLFLVMDPPPLEPPK
jgi:sialidase-1